MKGHLFPQPGRRKLCLAAVLAAGSGWAPLAAHGQSKTERSRVEKTRIQVAVAGKGWLHYLPLTIAERLGYFKAEGVELEIADLASAARSAQALASGAVDVVCSAYEHTFHPRGPGPASQAFVLMARTPQVAFGYSVKAMPGSPLVQDLKGKKIGVSATGTLTHMVASQIVVRAGLSPSDVSFVSVGSSAGALASLRSGQIDALCNTDPVMTALEQRGEIQLAFDTRTLHGSQAVFGGPMPTACLHAPVDFVQRHPHTVQAMTNAVVRASRWLHGVGPSELIRTVPEALLWEDRGLYLSAFNRMREAISLDGLMPDDGPRTVLRTWERFDPLLRFDPLELARTYTNEFARRANDRPLKTLVG